jgi:hypothetical protein
MTHCNKEEWRHLAINCKSTGFFHDWMPIAWIKSEGGGDEVSTLLCTKCFKDIDITSIFLNRRHDL